MATSVTKRRVLANRSCKRVASVIMAFGLSTLAR
jgi:hypothetical protein